MSKQVSIEHNWHTKGFAKFVGKFYGSDEEFADFIKELVTLNSYREEKRKKPFSFSVKKGKVKSLPKKVKIKIRQCL